MFKEYYFKGVPNNEANQPPGRLEPALPTLFLQGLHFPFLRARWAMPSSETAHHADLCWGQPQVQLAGGRTSTASVSFSATTATINESTSQNPLMAMTPFPHSPDTHALQHPCDTSPLLAKSLLISLISPVTLTVWKLPETYLLGASNSLQRGNEPQSKHFTHSLLSLTV